MSDAKLDKEDYIIGANESEVRRLGLQHALWRETALAAWRRAGVKPGMTVLDIGAGPGHASFDLAQLVGPEGKVVAVDQSELFLKTLEAGAAARGLANIETRHSDLAQFDWPEAEFDAVWCRWVLCFLPDPDGALNGVDKALKPGGVFVSQEYVDYRSFRLEPAAPVFEVFVDAVETSWRHFEGDPNIARRFPKRFAELGWEMEEMRPIVHAARPSDPIWRWPESWLEESPARLVELGFLAPEDATAFDAFVRERACDPSTLLITPSVLDSRARKPG